MTDPGLFATPQVITSTRECAFYHTMDIPGYGEVKGYWDLRPNVRRYLGEVDLKGKRVLEVGTASGYLCFFMEGQGAELIAFDLSDEQQADIIPYARHAWRTRAADHKAYMRHIRNGFWFAYRAFQSRAKVLHGTAYAIPETIGPVDVAVFAAILLHLRDPFLALQNALRLTRETVIVTEALEDSRTARLLRKLSRRHERTDRLIFVPNAATGEPPATWWLLRPGVVMRFLAVLGFEKTDVTYHLQKQEGGKNVPFFTVVGRRTAPMSE